MFFLKTIKTYVDTVIKKLYYMFAQHSNMLKKKKSKQQKKIEIGLTLKTLCHKI